MLNSHIRKSGEDKIVDAVIMIFMIFTFFVTFYPFYYSFILSFNEGLDTNLGGVYLWPRKFTLSNYEKFFTDSSWFLAYGVTALRTVIGTVFTMVITCLFAYALSFRELVFRGVYVRLVIFAMYFSGGVIPYYVTLRTLGLLNTFWVYIIPGGLNLFFVMVAISFFQEIPPALHEAAMLDGASEVAIFVKIILPVSLPLLATMAVFVGVGHWNSWYDSAFYVQNKQLRTVGYLLMEVVNKNAASHSMSAASAQMASQSQATPLSTQVTAMVISVVPILCIYPFFQRYFMTGLSIGAVKE